MRSRRDSTDATARLQAQHKVYSRLFLYIIVRQRAAFFKLLTCEYQALLIGRDAFFILNFLLDVVDSILRLDFDSYCFAGESFYEDLHNSARILMLELFV